VNWYNGIITRANRVVQEENSHGKKQNAIRQVILEAIVNLRRTNNPEYVKEDIDRSTFDKIEELSNQLAKGNTEEFIREGKSETRSNIMKFFTSLKNSIMGEPENPANFLDDLYKEVVRSEEFKTNASRKHMSSAVTKLKPEHSVAVEDTQKVDGKKIMKAGRENPDAVTQFNFDDLPPESVEKDSSTIPTSATSATQIKFDDLPRSTQENLRPSVHENLHPSTISVAPAAMRARSGRRGK
jgi:hypothetical protein